MRLVSVTPGAAGQQLQQQQGILGWEVHVAPSATLLSASQSSCSKQRQREQWLDGILIQSLTIASRFIIRRGACSRKTERTPKSHVSRLSPAFSKAQLRSRGTAIVKVFVCMHVTEWAGEGRQRNLALDFMPGWPSLKNSEAVSLWCLLSFRIALIKRGAVSRLIYQAAGRVTMISIF